MNAKPNRRADKTITFTTAWISKLTPPASGRVTYYDSVLPGFCLRITATGASSYSVIKKLAGRPVRVTIGAVDQIGLKAARDRASGAGQDGRWSQSKPGKTKT